jgi:hypothetical protein
MTTLIIFGGFFIVLINPIIFYLKLLKHYSAALKAGIASAKSA